MWGGAIGLEIGALTTPLVRKGQGKIIYVDHASTEELRQKYRDHETVAPGQIVQVDAVWGDKTIQEALTDCGSVDYVLASHVIEHVPDLVTWLNELASVLNNDGTIRLAIPDLRYCFDYVREPTRLTDIVTAFALRARRPQPREIIDFILQHRPVDLERAWRGELETSGISPERLEHVLDLVRRSLAGEYIDVHCWTFTLSSFATIMARLNELGLIGLACDGAFDTEVGEHEFFVILRVAEAAEAAQSWWKVANEASGPPSPEPETWSVARIRWMKITGAGSNLEVDRLRRELAAVYNSSSWKFSRPVRLFGRAMKAIRGK
jgi:SAM-dependent methyltransferase